MPNPHTSVGAAHLLQIFASAFLAILFLQSSFDKITDWRGNLSWLRGHFAKSPVASIVPLLLTILTFLELAAGILSGVGCIEVIIGRGSAVAFYGAVISAIALLALFLGQRLAKEYPGAATLVPYFLLALLAIYLLV